VTNARFVVHDLQDAPLDEGFDVVFSRFGVMFFSRPSQAFANVVASLRPDGRAGFVTWAPVDENPWMFVTNLAACAALGVELTPPAPGEPGPFALSDAGAFSSLLAEVGLVDVDVQRCRGRLAVPASSARSEVASMMAIGPAGDAYAAASTEEREAAIDAVLAAIEPFRTSDGWELPGCALVATGRRSV
jgi:SAM-dependent methyltransferase